MGLMLLFFDRNCWPFIDICYVTVISCKEKVCGRSISRPAGDLPVSLTNACDYEQSCTLISCTTYLCYSFATLEVNDQEEPPLLKVLNSLGSYNSWQ